MINFIYLQIKNVFNKISCLNSFLPWHEIQGTGLPPPSQRSCTCQLILIPLTEEKHQIMLLHRLEHPMGTLHDAKSPTACNLQAVLVAK